MNDRPFLVRLRAWRGRASSAAARLEPVLWIGAIVLVLWMQWPMLKGLYYRAAGTAPPAAAIAWHSDLDAALADARDTGRLVLVDFSADWCPPCITMKHDVWPDTDVRRAVGESYIPVLIDVDRQPAIAERYGVAGIPTVLILDGDGTVRKQASFLSASAMASFLRGG